MGFRLLFVYRGIPILLACSSGLVTMSVLVTVGYNMWQSGSSALGLPMLLVGLASWCFVSSSLAVTFGHYALGLY